MLEKVERAKQNVELARATHGYVDSAKGTLRGLLSEQEGKVGVMARMGGKLINYYSDDLTNMLLEDILSEVAIDLQKIERKEKKKQTSS